MEKNKTNESFVRWQSRSINELGKLINLLLSLCLATLGFVISKLLDKQFLFNSCSDKYLILYGISIILLSTILHLILTYNRFLSFRYTTQLARNREKGKRENIESLRFKIRKIDNCTWKLFKFSILTFCVGQILIILGFIIEIKK